MIMIFVKKTLLMITEQNNEYLTLIDEKIHTSKTIWTVPKKKEEKKKRS